MSHVICIYREYICGKYVLANCLAVHTYGTAYIRYCVRKTSRTPERSSASRALLGPTKEQGPPV